MCRNVEQRIWGTLTVRAGFNVNTNNNEVTVTAFDFDLAGSLNSGARSTTVVEASVTPVEALTVTVILSLAAAPSPHRAVATDSRCKTMPAEEKSGALKPKTGAGCNMGVDMAQCMKIRAAIIDD